MKAFNKIIAVAAIVALSSCADSFLNREPHGSTITQTQYEKLDNTLAGSMRGIYALMYTNSSTDHDVFGRRAIDLYTDLLSGDMALTSYSYGWFYTDERGMTSTSRTGTVWSYYYKMLHNTNTVLRIIANQSEVTKKVAEYGLPNTYDASSGLLYVINGKDTLYTYTENEVLEAGYYAQALTMRGYVLTGLVPLYTYTTAQLNGDLKNTKAFPVYTESNMDNSQGYSALSEVYTQLESDLTTAIDYFGAFGQALTRASKLEPNIDVARGLLAYSYLNKANPNASSSSDAYRTAYTNALKYAKDVIESGTYSVLPNKEIWTNGFNNVNSTCWIWGQDVTTETASGLASFFGQVDIHTYSYAWAGDTKAIDENLYNAIPDFDARKRWFNDGMALAKFKYCPDKKFFSAKCPTSTKQDDIDREWLSDNVFMRVEAMYLIAAEAEYRLGEYDQAKSYLQGIMDQRVDTASTAAAEYATYMSGLNNTNLLSAIEYNWRVELWGEGYGLQTFRRLSPETAADTKRRRGSNHASEAGSEIDATAAKFTFAIPSSETSYNPNLKGETTPLE